MRRLGTPALIAAEIPPGTSTAMHLPWHRSAYLSLPRPAGRWLRRPREARCALLLAAARIGGSSRCQLTRRRSGS